MREYLKQTDRERLGGIDGINLFFGALLGANLGMIDRLPLRDYAMMIIILAGTVVTLRMVSTSERRAYALMTLLVYIFLVSLYLFLPALRAKGLSDDATARLGVTLAIWVGAVLFLEFGPTHRREIRPAEEQAPPEADAPPPR